MKPFKPYSPDQSYLLPPGRASGCGRTIWPTSSATWWGRWTCPIVDAYTGGDDRGQPPYHPAMMVKLLVYAYCVGKPSSRKIEKATYEEVPFRVLAADQHPDHDSIADFRPRHLAALSGLFAQVLPLCRRRDWSSWGTWRWTGRR